MKKEILQCIRLRDQELYVNILWCIKRAGLNGIIGHKTIA